MAARTGNLPESPELRLFSKIMMGDSCWPWQGYVAKHGYGVMKLPPDRMVQVHRLAYELWVGPIPVGLQLDHLCRNPTCVRPDHLEPVTQAENVRRGFAARMGGRCIRGHIRPPGLNNCNPCARIGHARRKAQRELGYIGFSSFRDDVA